MFIHNSSQQSPETTTTATATATTTSDKEKQNQEYMSPNIERLAGPLLGLLNCFLRARLCLALGGVS